MGAATDGAMTDDVLTFQEACALLKVGKTCLYTAVKNGDVPCFRIGGLIRFRRRELLGETEHERKGGKS